MFVLSKEEVRLWEDVKYMLGQQKRLKVETSENPLQEMTLRKPVRVLIKELTTPFCINIE